MIRRGRGLRRNVKRNRLKELKEVNSRARRILFRINQRNHPAMRIHQLLKKLRKSKMPKQKKSVK